MPYFGGYDDFLMIEDRKYRINTDFRVWLRVYDIIRSGMNISADGISEIFMLILPRGSSIPADIGAAVSAAVGFLLRSMGEKEVRHRGRAKAKKVFDFAEDEGLIYAAFLAQYGIDLFKVEYLHWYSFLDLLNALCGEHRLLEIIRIRGMNLQQLHSKREKQYYRKMKQYYKLNSEDEGSFSDDFSALF